MTFKKGEGFWTGKKRSLETNEKIRKTKLKNPTRYWLGKKRPDMEDNSFGFREGHTPWNKGLTKEIDERVRKASEDMERILKIKKTTNDKEWIKKHCESVSKSLKGSDTKIERLVENQLLFNSILYVKQYPYEYGIADFWLPESNIIIHCDGEYWHNKSNVIERDKRQDEWLELHNYNVFRFTESQIKSSPIECFNIIKGELQ